MISLYLTCALLIALMLTCDIFILVHPYVSIKKYPVFFILFSVLFFIQMYLSFSPILLLTLFISSILLVKFSKQIYSIIYIPLGYMTNCIFIYLIGFPLSKLLGQSIEALHMDVSSLIILISCTIASTCFVLYSGRLQLQKYLISTFEKMSKSLFVLIVFTIILCAFLMYTIASFLGIVDISNSDYLLLISLLALFFLFTIATILIVLHTTKKNYEAQKKVEYLEHLNEYTKNLEMVYNNLRSFKHDYVNIMTSLATYIDEKKYDELEHFFYEHILPMQKNLTQKNATLTPLLHIDILEIKSILYAKLLSAINQDIAVTLDIPDRIDAIHMESIDLIRMLGIYLDNAIEACLETEYPILNFHLGKFNNSVVFIISNSFIDKGLSIAQMQKKDATTKGNGHGLGLSNATEILNHYDNIFHETLIEDGLFIQRIQIS